METFDKNGKRKILIDLSDPLDNSTASYELNRHEIHYFDHEESVRVTEDMLGIGREEWRDGVEWAVEG